MREDLERLAHIPSAMLNFHPGSHVRQGVEIGVRYIADMLDAVMAEGTATPILLETMAGKGSEVGRLDDVLGEFDRVLGLSRLRAIHLNDSKNPMGSRKDRHEQIGRGSLGLDAIAAIINHPALRNLPFYLETPNEPEGYAREIALLRGLYKGE